MRRALVVAVALGIAGVATAGSLGPSLNLSPGLPSPVVGRVEYNTTNSPLGVGPLTATKPAGAVVTWTRNATETVCPTSDATCYTVAANTPAVGQYGAWVGPAYTVNAYSDAFGSWTAFNAGTGTAAPVVDPGNYADPLGGTNAKKVAFSATDAPSERSILYISTSATAGPYVASVWVKGVSGSGNLCIAQGASSWSWANCAYTSSTWSRCSTNGSLATATQYLTLGSEASICGYSAAQDVYLFRANWTAGATLYPAVASGASPVNQPVTAASVASTRAVGPGCIGATATLANWSSSAKRWLVSQGTAEGANSLSLGLDASNNLVCDSYDAGTTQKKAVVAQSLTALSSHSALCCWDGSSPTIWLDGVPQTVTLSGAGTGPAAIGTLYLGSGSNAGAGAMGGWASKWVECKSARGGACK